MPWWFLSSVFYIPSAACGGTGIREGIRGTRHSDLQIFKGGGGADKY